MFLAWKPGLYHLTTVVHLFFYRFMNQLPEPRRDNLRKRHSTASIHRRSMGQTSFNSFTFQQIQ